MIFFLRARHSGPIALLALIAGCHEPAKQGTSEKIQQRPAEAGSWAGTWERQEWQNDASLEISGIRGDTLVFTLNAFNGGHTGQLEGNAVVTGNRAVYYSPNEFDTCSIIFSLRGDTAISITQEQGLCDAGMDVTYTGSYKSSRLAKAAPEEHLLHLGMLKTPEEEQTFRSLAGDSYDLFLNATQLISENDDLDSLGARVQSAGVRGLFTYQENIIMADSAGHIWAAVIDDNKVLYFTNSAAWKGRLPKTIEAWRERFMQYPVIYK